MANQPAQIIENMPIADYHASAAYSKSGLKVLADPRKTPEHFWAEYRAPNRKPRAKSPEQTFGTAFHTYVLEPEKFATEYVIGPVINKNTKEWKSFVKTTEASGQQVISAKDVSRINAMAERLQEHPAIWELITGTETSGRLIEASMFWTDPLTGLPCKARPDIFHVNDGIVPDLKTTQSASAASFANDVINYGYDIQDASYTSGINILYPDMVQDFFFICVETEPPYALAMHKLTDEFKAIGYHRYRQAINLAAACEASGRWPGYPTLIQDLPPPRWAAKKYLPEFADQEEDDYEPQAAA